MPGDLGSLLFPLEILDCDLIPRTRILVAGKNARCLLFRLLERAGRAGMMFSKGCCFFCPCIVAFHQ